MTPMAGPLEDGSSHDTITDTSAQQPVGSAPIVELVGICKYYGNNAALQSVDMTVSGGEVVGLVGDNGSGKSTLVKIMAGYHQPNSGSIRFRGEAVSFKSPADARARGIEVVYQDLALIEDLCLWRNFFLKREMWRRIGPMRVLRKGQMMEVCREQLDGLGLLHIRSLDQAASSLSGGEKQSVAITRAVHFGASLLILDEPTAALSVRETENVLKVIANAAKEGLGVVYIDHRLDHVYPVADRIVLLEHGRVAASFTTGEKSLQELRELVARVRPDPQVMRHR
jgi:simple sugar transport system ATP-binding protein